MFKTNRFLNILLAVCIMSASMILVSCDLFKTDQDSSNDMNSTEVENPEDVVIEDDPTTKDYDNGISFDEEAEGYQPKLKKSEAAEFIGKWEATSGNAHYLLGNLEMEIKEGGIWVGNITEEKVRGTWKETSSGLSLKSNLFNCNLAFSSTDKLLLEYLPFEDSEDSVILVMTKVE